MEPDYDVMYEAHLEAEARELRQEECQKRGRHKWATVGGGNAGCGPDCECSVPVKECLDCELYDYGDNAEAREVEEACTRHPRHRKQFYANDPQAGVF